MGIETELLVKAVAKGFEGIEKNFKDLETAEEKAAVKAAVLSRESNRLSQELADGKKNLAQVTSEMKKLDDSMPIDGLQEMGDETSSLSTKWQEMSSKIDVAKQAFAAVAGTAQAVFDTMKEGATIKAASDNFDTLTESMGGATPALEGMRGATKGMVDDMTLMSSANALMTMGIASTSEELAKNVQIVTRLKKPTDDAATAMENWALLMANQSLPRLDSFGISSGAVRVRIKELMEATEGLTREQAFNTAVLAEAEISMTKVADASEGQLANIERLEAGWANLKNTMSVAVADALVPAVETAGNMATQTQEMAEAADSGHSAWSNALVVMNELNKTMGGIPADEWVQGVRDAESASIMLKDQLILVDEAMSSFDASITQNTTNLDLQSERLAANAQAAIDYSADMAAAAGEDENLTDKLGQQNNMLTESETQLIKSQQATDTLSASAKAASDNTALLGASATITAEQI